MLRRFKASDIRTQTSPDYSCNKSFGLVTRSGVHAQIIAVLPRNIPARLVVVVGGKMENYYANGRYELVHESELDLFVKEL